MVRLLPVLTAAAEPAVTHLAGPVGQLPTAHGIGSAGGAAGALAHSRLLMVNANARPRAPVADSAVMIFTNRLVPNKKGRPHDEAGR
jgi:hypothetical protein